MDEATAPVAVADPWEVQRAAVRAVAYADVFDYPLTAGEVHRYLHGVAATPEETAVALETCSAAGLLSRQGEFFLLRGRDHLGPLRRKRTEQAERLWPAARLYGGLIAEMPFVRMVAVTGSLAWDNPPPQADIDYLIVCAPGRLWLGRLGVALIRRLAARRGVVLCANYMITEGGLSLTEHDIYTAYELARMQPIAGLATYRRMWALNPWVGAFLPNAFSQPFTHAALPHAAQRWAARMAEALLGSELGTALERIEMNYRLRKMHRWLSQEADLLEAAFGPDCIKAHTRSRGRTTVAAFTERLERLGAGVA